MNLIINHKGISKKLEGDISGTPQHTKLVINNATKEIENMILFGATIKIDDQVINNYDVESSLLEGDLLTVKMSIL